MSIDRCEKHDCEMVDPQRSEFLPVTITLKPYCPQCVAESKAAHEVYLLAESQAWAEYWQRRKFAARYDHLNIGKRFASATFDGYQAVTPAQVKAKTTCQRYTETFVDRLAGGDGLILSGNPGTGKNHLAASIAKGVVDHGRTVIHSTAMKLVREIKETWAKGSERTEREAIESFIAPDLLIIDEVGVQFGSQTEQILLMEIINARYADMRPTILITMFGIDELKPIVGPQIIDRFNEGKSSVVKFTWESHRGKA